MPSVKDVIVKKPSNAEVRECKSWPTWGCEISTFPWVYEETETCLLLEGEVTVTDQPEGADSVSFGPGDMVTFPVGLKCIWKVSQPVKKHYNFS